MSNSPSSFTTVPSDYAALFVELTPTASSPHRESLPPIRRASVSLGSHQHVRRRSVAALTPDISMVLENEDGRGAPSATLDRRNASVCDSRSSMGGDESEDLDEKDPLHAETRTQRSRSSYTGPVVWRDGRMLPKRRALRLVIVGVVFSLFALVGDSVGRVTSGIRSGAASTSRTRSRASPLKASGRSSCNPYQQYGVLNVNTSTPSENMWQPIAATDDCVPVDFLSLLRRAQVDRETVPELDFARNRLIVIYGDSIDRDHVEHMCFFVGGAYEMVGVGHRFSPPYPKERALPPEDYVNVFTGTREWPNFHQSRPFVCHLDALNFHFLNVFHYGFRPETHFMVHHPHYYPPATIEDRFDQIVVPLAAAVSKEYNLAPAPDIFSITPGFWELLRQSNEDLRAAQTEVEAGVDWANALADTVWRTMDREEIDWTEKRVTEALKHVAKGWTDEADQSGRRKPTILWRALHFVKETNSVPYNRVVTLDQIGRSVVDKLIAEGKAAEAAIRGFTAWTTNVGSRYFGWRRERLDDAVWDRFGDRLRVDEWGSLMLGQSQHFRDELHPLPLPGSYLYGNMLLHELKMATAGQETAVPGPKARKKRR